MAINLRSSTTSETSSTPAILAPGQINMTLTGLVGKAGQAMGMMGLTYSKPEIEFGTLEYQVNSGTSDRLSIRLDK